MSHRLFFTYNRPENIDNHYVVGAGVGSKSRFARSALRRRSSNNARGKPCCFPMPKPLSSEPSFSGNIVENKSVDDSLLTDDLILKHDNNNKYESSKPLESQTACYMFGPSFEEYSVNDTSLCCLSADTYMVNGDPSGCKDINSVCYLEPNGGLNKACPNNKIINCSNIKYKCGSDGTCKFGTDGYNTYSDCIQKCSSPPPPPPPPRMPTHDMMAKMQKKVIYIDTLTSVDDENSNISIEQALNNISDASFNIINLSFLVTNSTSTPSPVYSVDMAAEWEKLAEKREQIVATYNKKNVFIMASAGGGECGAKPNGPCITSNDMLPWIAYESTPNDYGSDLAKWVIDNCLNGIDFDLENILRGFYLDSPKFSSAALIKWISTATNSARKVFEDQEKKDKKYYYISHAPQAAYFGPIDYNISDNNCDPIESCYTGVCDCGEDGKTCWCPPGFTFNYNTPPHSTGGYSKIYQDCSNSIDFLNIQYYNQGVAGAYTDYSTLFLQSRQKVSGAPGTAYFQLTKYGIPQQKIVIGRPLWCPPTCHDSSGCSNCGVEPPNQADANNGWVSDVNLCHLYSKASKDTNYTLNTLPSTMVWQYKNASPDSVRNNYFKSWIKNVYNKNCE